MLFGLQEREKQHVADAFRTGENHGQAVNADAETAGRGHSVFKGAEEILVHRLRFGVACGFENRLRFKPFALVESGR